MGGGRGRGSAPQGGGFKKEGEGEIRSRSVLQQYVWQAAKRICYGNVLQEYISKHSVTDSMTPLTNDPTDDSKKLNSWPEI